MTTKLSDLDRLRKALEWLEKDRSPATPVSRPPFDVVGVVMEAARRFLALTETGFDANALYDYLDEEFAMSEQVGRETFLAHAYDMSKAALADYLTEEET